MEEVCSACSAQQAREILLENPIDILLCDIEMPKESGLELFAWVRKRKMNVECVFLTSHAEFSYAKEALKLGSFDYILQPARYEEIEEALMKVRNQILKNRKFEKLKEVQEYRDEIQDGIASECLWEIMEYGNHNENAFNRIFDLQLKNRYSRLETGVILQEIIEWKTDREEWKSGLLLRSIRNILQEIFAEHKLEVILLKYRRTDYVILVCGEHVDHEVCYECISEYHLFEKEYMDFHSALYLGNVVENGKFADEINRIIHFMRNNIMKKTEISLCANDVSEESKLMSNILRIERWEYYLENGRGRQIIEKVKNYFENPDNQNKNTLKVLFWSFNSAIVVFTHKKNVEYSSLFLEKEFPFKRYLEAYRSYDELIFAMEFLVDILERKRGKEEGRDEEDIVCNVISYIDDNLAQSLSRKMLADYVHMNEDYLARIFKKNTGYTLKEFIVKEKMEFAMELLRTTNMSISLIALKTGFTNFSHFSQTFKKAANVTPNEYRNQNRNN